MIRRGATLACLGATIAGCTVGPDYRAPQPNVPKEWAGLPGGSADSTAASREMDQSTGSSNLTSSKEPDLAQWWRSLSDPQLDKLIESAISGNLELRIAEARIMESRLQRAVVAGGRYPMINTTASYSRRHPSENGQLGELNSGITKVLVGEKILSDYELYQAGFDASWELDFFGAVRRRIEAADANAEAAEEARRDVLITVVAEVARNYIELRGAQRRLAIARSHLAGQQSTLELVRQKRSAGLVTDLDVFRASAEVSLSESRIPLLTRQIRFAIHSLSALLPRDIESLSDELLDPAPIPTIPDEILVGFPAELLRRRPDIRRAERELAAATAQIGAATADLYPRLALGGTFGMEATRFASLGDWDSRTYGFGPSLHWPVFDAGRIRANIGVQSARQEQAMASYERSVIAAIREVEDTLAIYTTERDRSRWLSDSAESSRQSVDLAQLAYEQGATDLLAVLDAQRALYSTQDTLAETEQNVVTSLVALYKTLGGGWDAATALSENEPSGGRGNTGP